MALVIPAYNEEAYLPRLLDTVDAARAALSGGAVAIEVIVADNASTDCTAAIAVERGCQVVRVEKRVIGAARNGGGRAAHGEILCFVDADMRIHPQTFNAIDRALEDPRIVAGATGAWPERWSLGLAATVAVMLPIAILARVDTGVVFCRRADYEAIGGYRGAPVRGGSRVSGGTVAPWAAAPSAAGAGHSARAIASTRKFDKYRRVALLPAAVPRARRHVLLAVDAALGEEILVRRPLGSRD